MNKGNEEYHIADKLDKIAMEIYMSFNFNEEKVVYKLDDQKEIACAYGSEIDNKFNIVVGIKNYIDVNAMDEKQDVYFRNTMFHEFVHAQTWVSTPQSLKDAFKGNESTYARWAYKLVDDYRAYGRANEKYKQDLQFLKNDELEIVKIFEHYCNALTFKGGKPDDSFFRDIYYDLGTAFIAHRFVNPHFPTIKDKNYIRFVETYLNHLKQVSENELKEYTDFEELGKQLLKDFKLLFSVVKGRHKNNSFMHFITNSHMK